MITALLLAATLLNPTGKPAKAALPVKTVQVQTDTVREINYLKKIDDIYKALYECGDCGDYEVAVEASHLRDETPRNGAHLHATYYVTELSQDYWDT